MHNRTAGDVVFCEIICVCFMFLLNEYMELKNDNDNLWLLFT